MSGSKDQVLRFAAGDPAGARSRTWRLWVPKGKSDVYVSGRTLGSSIKVSIHEPGPARFALTSQWIRQTGFQAPPGRDRRLAIEWNRPRPRPPRQAARPFCIVVPFDEILKRDSPETERDIVWMRPPPVDTCINFDIVYCPSGVVVTGHPGARSMKTELVGKVTLANGEIVFVTSRIIPMEESLRLRLIALRSATIRDATGAEIRKTGMLAFGKIPNPDANDGPEVATFLDVTRP